MKTTLFIKKAIIFTSCIIAGTILIYLIGALMWAELDIKKWDSIGRGAYILFTEIAVVTAAITIAIEITETN